MLVVVGLCSLDLVAFVLLITGSSKLIQLLDY